VYVPTSALLDRAHAVLTGKSRSYVEDAPTFAHALVAIGTGIWTQPAPDIKQVLLEPSEEIERLRRQVRQLTDQLTIVQERCTQLFLENRRGGTMTINPTPVDLARFG
jgi:hypothetical protein